MGMFDKDKEIGNQVTSAFQLGEQFVLLGVTQDKDKVATAFGDATKTRMKVCKLAADGKSLHGQPFEVTTLGGAIADKAALATADDFPCVVELRRVATNKGNPATVLQFVGSFDGTTDDIPF